MVDKPKGLTSFDIVAHTRKQFHCKAVGHTGTLDPFATGLLVLLLGRYTRLCQYITAQDKTYEAEICFGVGTDTDDCDGQVISQQDASGLDRSLAEAALDSFLGKQLQTPPQYSAISINGERSYKKARRGEIVIIEPRPIEVFEIETLSWPKNHLLSIRLRVSKGTYIRAIARDLGVKLGMPAHLSNLRRIASGSYHINECSNQLKIGIEAIRDIPLLSITQATSEALKKGQKPATELPGGLFLTHCLQEPIAIVNIDSGRMLPIRGF